MEDYFTQLLNSRSTSNEQQTIELANNESTNETNILDTNEDQSTDNEEETTTNEDQPIHGSSNRSAKVIIYSFIPKIYDLLAATNQFNITNIYSKIDDITKEVHDNLENQFYTSAEISERIVEKIVEHIISVSSKYDYIYVPVTMNTSVYNISPFYFKLITSNSSMSFSYRLILINPDAELLLQQITKNYISTHTRYSLNRSTMHILRNYIEASNTSSNKIQFEKSYVDKAFKTIPSAFTDQNDQDRFILQFYSKLQPTHPPTNYIIHSLALNPPPSTSIINISQSNLSTESFKELLSKF